MDVGGLTGLVAACLPFLVEAGRRFGEDAAAELGDNGWDIAKRIWQKLRPRVEERPAAKEAVDDVAAAPDDPRAVAALELQLEKVVAGDAALAAELEALLEEARASGVVAAGDRSVAIGGDVSGSTITTGDNNTIGR